MPEDSQGFTWDHLLYRLFDADDTLLYIGRTNNIKNRFARHATLQPWWSAVARSAVETLPSYEALCAAEKAAILGEKPRYNVVYNGQVLADVVGEHVPGWLSINLRVTAAATALHSACREGRGLSSLDLDVDDSSPCGWCALEAVAAVRAIDAAAGHADPTVDEVETSVIHEESIRSFAVAAASDGLVSSGGQCECDECASLHGAFLPASTTAPTRR